MISFLLIMNLSHLGAERTCPSVGANPLDPHFRNQNQRLRQQLLLENDHAFRHHVYWPLRQLADSLEEHQLVEQELAEQELVE